MSITNTLSPESMLGIGIGLLAIGLIIWNLPRLQKKKVDLRYSRVRGLRLAGEEERASQLKAATDSVVQRASVSGLFLLMGGVFAVLASVWSAL